MLSTNYLPILSLPLRLLPLPLSLTFALLSTICLMRKREGQKSPEKEKKNSKNFGLYHQDT